MATRGKKEKEYPPMPANWMYKRGDVYMMDLNPYSGSEQGGVRPAIVVQNDDGNFYSNVLLVVPLTTQIKKRNMPTHFIYATFPKYTAKKRDIWTAETLFHALEVCDDPRLRLCINLSFSCSLRLGELLGLTWDCVDISPESIEAGRASIYINKELQRVDIASLNALENKNVITRFPSLSSRCTTVQVLKSPKTDSSIRTIFLPKTVAEMLVHYKAEQDMTKDALGAEYADYNLVVAGPLGMPTEQSTINGALKQLIEENDLPKVVFHSFRHSSITYKLKLNGGDIKAVQGDSGHAQASMVTEQYAHILDDDRRLNAQRFDDFFYQHHGAEPEALPRAEQSTPKASPVDTDAVAALAKLLADPSMATLIKNLAKNL